MLGIISIRKINITSSFSRKLKQRRMGFGKIKMLLIRGNGEKKEIVIIDGRQIQCEEYIYL